MRIGPLFYNASTGSSTPTTSTVFSLRKIGGTSQPKNIVFPMELGRNIRDSYNQNVSEILIKPDLTIFSPGTIITSATLTYVVTACALSHTPGAQIEILRNIYSWTEDASTPQYSIFPDYGWGTLDAIDSTIWGIYYQATPITKTMTCNSTMLTILNSWISNPSTNNGYILQLNCNSLDYVTINNIYFTFTV